MAQEDASARYLRFAARGSEGADGAGAKALDRLAQGARAPHRSTNPMANLELARKRDLSPFRWLALGTWRTSYSPAVYGTLDVRAEPLLSYLDELRAKTGKRITITHLVVKAAATALREHPDANAIVRFNRIYTRKRIGVLVQVALTTENDEIDLSAATLHDVDEKSVSEIAEELDAKLALVRSGRDPDLEKTRRRMRYVPLLLIQHVLRFLSFVLFTLNLDLRFFGIPKDPFGSIMVSNIGALGLGAAYVPFVPYSRIPILLAVGMVRDAPVIEEGRVAAGKVLTINATFDHRFLDGVHAARMAATLRACLERPHERLGPP
jgi:hypothetical protein